MSSYLFIAPICLLGLIGLGGRATAQVQPADTLSGKRSVWQLGGGTGLIIPLGLPATIFRQVGINAQVGITHEYHWRRRWSLLTGAEYRLQNLAADARFKPVLRPVKPAEQILVEPAPDSIKYSSLRYQLISVPLMVRHYLARTTEKRLFVDIGVSFNFPVGTSYRYRSAGETRRQNLLSFIDRPILMLEVAGGANGKLFGGRLSKANQILGSLLFGGFVNLNSPLRTQQDQPVSTAGFLTRFVF